jgi:hypothetical protein
MSYPYDYPKIFKMVVGLVVRLWTLNGKREIGRKKLQGDGIPPSPSQ